MNLNSEMLANLCRQALAEDIGSGDATTLSIVSPELAISALVVTREVCILAGIPVVRQVFEECDPSLKFDPLLEDGASCTEGQTLATVSGSARSILTAERTALNFLQRLSGIATITHSFVGAVGDSKTRILDTRKTTPGLRMLEKYAVEAGGGTNHRFGLFDRILVKDNHLYVQSLSGTGSITEIVKLCRTKYPNLEVEVEIESLDQLEEALKSSVEYVLLDNMSDGEMADAVRLRDQHRPTTMLEASGGMTIERVNRIAKIGLDFISVGALTHSPKAIDMALDFQDAPDTPSH